mmetsp:Transcript_13344/g.28963  ORF Transcript_13344/g.28963 Transcript_13344/m.28963 type:complete len:123 (+) Transcript_13344:120-488(+)
MRVVRIVGSRACLKATRIDNLVIVDEEPPHTTPCVGFQARTRRTYAIESSAAIWMQHSSEIPANRARENVARVVVSTRGRSLRSRAAVVCVAVARSTDGSVGKVDGDDSDSNARLRRRMLVK